MEVQEFDNALTELETRVDRLRALYENWFRGYEKTEPSVARKDVERRVYGLRKELPRNTALRFRYHQLYQRFSTLANYWQRTARQVEEGTYRMQVQRMRRRKDDQLARSMVPRAAEAEHEGPEHRSYELNLDETLDVGSLLDDFELDQVANAIDAPGPYAEPQTTRPVARFRPPGAGPSKAPAERPSLTLDALQSFGGIPAIMAPPAANDSQSTTPPMRGSLPMPTVPAPRRPSAEEVTGRPPPSMAAKPTAAAALEEQLLAASKGRIPTSVSALAQPAQPRSELDERAERAALQRIGLEGSAAQAQRAGARPAPGNAGIAVPARPALAAPLPPSPGPAAQPPLGAVPARQPPFVGPGAPLAASPPGRPSNASTSTATGTRPAVPAPPAARPPVPPPPAPRVPAPPQPAPRAALPAAPAPAPRPAAASGPASGGAISDQQIRRIYDDYVAARRKNNEGDVRYETLASSINKMLPDLQKRHHGKRIDFEVVLKDGRVGLKPKAT